MALLLTLVAGAACARDSVGVDGESGSSGGPASSDTEPQTTEGSTAQASSDTGSTSDGTATLGDSSSTNESTTGVGDGCTPPDPDVLQADAVALAPNWPAGGFSDVICDATEIQQDPPAVAFSCAHPETGLPSEVRIRLPAEMLENQLAWLPGVPGLRLSFFVPPEGAIVCFACNHVTIRDPEGGLLLLSHLRYMYDGYLPRGETMEVGKAEWLQPGSIEYAEWSAPFETFNVQNLGCEERASLRVGSQTETPLALEFVSDLGLVRIYDRNAEYGIPVQGVVFDVIVSDAFFRGPLECGDCPVTESIFSVVRAVRG